MTIFITVSINNSLLFKLRVSGWALLLGRFCIGGLFLLTVQIEKTTIKGILGKTICYFNSIK